ncbi:nucleoside deaminase [Clostridium magnum]|uniref:tRNA-specific adenosine deaminase n=1 Tax=Clostridium magnum DSM 2767 TaxID=1121326 RepID=A0A162QDF0_9CLOT|nr:nucleoside deaminase [Clostridium magnum]KZL88427.1 tRNA-specific adenosine deaminase [Clostridium magnum DSM 2767]SHJ26841.1 tRNA-adenosine deaminase [Clostridium magnum DSM 2767]
MHKSFMLEAIHEAKKSLILKEVPVGAVIVKEDKIIARAHNLRETQKDPTAHAEILAIKKASEVIENWRLSGCSMYVTLEPCPMCAGAILQSRISNLYIGTFDPTAGACGSVVNILQNDSLNHWTNIHWAYNEDCSNILVDFFKKRR